MRYAKKERFPEYPFGRLLSLISEDMSSLYITLGHPGWEDALRYECDHAGHILLQRPEGNADALIIKAEAILKENQFERQAGQNNVGSFVSYQKVTVE